MANTIGWGQAAVNNTIDWGKGKTNNTIGWGTIYSSSPYGDTDLVGTPAGDADALAFISAAAITDATQKSAIDKLVVDLKGYGIWTKMKGLYPFVGGTASQHKFNLKNPVDSNAAFRLTFYGGWTHSSSGILGNASNVFADTFFTPSANTAQNSFSFATYTTTNTNGLYCDLGYGVGTTGSCFVVSFNRWLDTQKGIINSDLIYNSGASLNSLGLFSYSRTAVNVMKNFKNGALNATSTTATNGNNAGKIAIGCQNNNGNISYPTNRNIAFAYMGDGFTDTENTNLYTAVQAFQTTLGRNV
jgi:hypothetical protein